MAKLSTGGGSSAPAASTHSGCERFRGSDPLLTGISRRDLAKRLGHPDDQGTIPEARWVRAMTFEKLVQQQPLATRFVTQALGAAGFDRPAGVVAPNPERRSSDDSTAVGTTARLLREAHDRAVDQGVATLVHSLTLPFPGIPGDGTPVKPDFAIIAPSSESGFSDLLMGDAKDYERVRSRIDDNRLLKGFLQVALGAEAAEAWPELPRDMLVSEFGVLAVPRNSFLQPTPSVEKLRDYRREVSDRIAERRAAMDGTDRVEDAVAHAQHLEATFDPVGCASCSLFAFCRSEVRASKDPASLLIELGVPQAQRPSLVDAAAGGVAPPDSPASLVATIRATQSGRAILTGQRRVDPAGQPGTVNVVIAKSDGGSLGVHGIALRTITTSGPSEWDERVFPDPLAAATRNQVMRALGAHLLRAMKAMKASDEAPSPVHVVVPDSVTADLLVSIADNLAGIELSRLRWQRDIDQARDPLTFDGEPADVPRKLHPQARTAVSFLLEGDRSRAIRLRSAIVDLRGALARLVVAGGPPASSLRLDYLVGWAETIGGDRLEHRAFADDIETHEHTPGARLTSGTSNAIFTAQKRAKGGDAATYESLVRRALAYKQSVVDRTLSVLADMPQSGVREIHRAIEGDAQAVWRRRLAFEANDLVRFGRVYNHWRNVQVAQIEADTTCSGQLDALGNPQRALDMALDPGNRNLLVGDVVSLDPLTVRVNSRRVQEDDNVALLHVEQTALVDELDVDITPQSTAFKITGIPVATLTAVERATQTFELSFTVDLEVGISVGDRLVLARYDYFGTYKNLKGLKVGRPGLDDQASPGDDCTPESYFEDPTSHLWCCRSHTHAEAEWSDQLADRRARGQLNPQVWPPALDEDGFEVVGKGQPTADTVEPPPVPIPDDASLSDID